MKGISYANFLIDKWLTEKTQDQALNFCRQNYTDLTPVSTELDIGKLQVLSNVTAPIWIGLERSSPYRNKWRWSRGGEVSRFYWAPGQSQNRPTGNYGFIHTLWSTAAKNVWIGLRFLSEDWLWVDGQEMDYKAWGQGGKPSCPNTKVNENGVWRACDCEERLNFICY
uniref:C-type lectin domain-containing protein n=1 Tax=Amphilophus citrinellus TaxID=61819 RepID=A0A3Q0R0N0_AMPCI